MRGGAFAKDRAGAAEATAGAPIASAAPAGERIHLSWRAFSFPLTGSLRTAAGSLAGRRGWLLRLQRTQGGEGWGEAAPLAFGEALDGALERCALALRQLRSPATREELERRLPSLPPPLAFALGAALAEADGLVGEAGGGWRPAPASAWLLPAGEEALTVARSLLAARSRCTGFALGQGPPPDTDPEMGGPVSATPLTLKWKVGVHSEREERVWHRQLVALLPADARLRLDANGGFDRATAWRWADHLRGDAHLDWLEQPLDPADQEGLEALARQLPVALDESLLRAPELRHRWAGWQVRRPSQEGDPRPLLRALEEGRPRWMVSTSFETGIGQRWLAHLAALQVAGPTPAAPGLAPGWLAPGDLGSAQPEAVWQAVGESGATGVPRVD